MAEQVWHRGFLIAPAYMGYCFEHPAFDAENSRDWRAGHGNTVQECRDEIDLRLEENGLALGTES